MTSYAVRLCASAALLAAAPALPTAAFAQPRLLTSAPAANSAVRGPTRLTLTFSEALAAPASGIELTMVAMPGMADHRPMPIREFATSVSGAVVTVALPRALPMGTYRLQWHAAGADRQEAAGQFDFTVR